MLVILWGLLWRCGCTVSASYDFDQNALIEQTTLSGIFFGMCIASIGSLWARRHQSRVVLVITTCLFFTSTGNASKFMERVNTEPDLIKTIVLQFYP